MPNDLQRIADDTVDLGAGVPPLYAYTFLAVASNATLTGYYVNKFGVQISAVESYSITTSSAVTLLSLASDAFPAGAGDGNNAVGFVGTVNEALYVGIGGLATGAITAGMTPAAGYPQIAAGNLVMLGRCNHMTYGAA